ncbi:3-hydroxyacyl-CoA dehydrogenase family protein [Pseudonocardia nigra]|uniref:3-hydroxyacyl-CoA dehydrogenase family protein n=1 Tax=Pseudonocardia nigra TaxID=1921578 RepID=UPI001C5DA8AD|nr:3-hydroxyacyl-CoA dehydrogenase family protein [Pseudonocardia nigra]
MGRRVGVLGAGVMGSGIAQVLAAAGHDVVCHDLSADALAAGEANVRAGRFGLGTAVERGKLSAKEADAALRRLCFTGDVERLYDTDVVVEAVPERLDLKVTVFRDLDRRCRQDTILASNSSGFPISALAAATDRPDRVIGWHWASPAPVMKLAEIVRAPSTSDATTEFVVDLAEGAGKNPVVIKDAPLAWGYVANRVYFAMVCEAARVVQEGVATAEEVDQLMIDCFRWPTGPLAMTRGAGTGWS